MDEVIENSRKTPVGPSARLWRKSSYSMSDGHCVEVVISGKYVMARDSKNANGPELMFGAPGWYSFIQAMKS
jgi:hypothetical protein